MVHLQVSSASGSISIIWVFVVMIGVGGCATHPVSFEASFPGATSFDRALMAYVQGELEVSLQELQKQHEDFPGDLRAPALRIAILREQGEDVLPSDAAYDQEVISGVLAPEELLQRSQERNPEIRQRIHDIIGARAKWREARLSFTPEFFALTRFHPGGFFIRLTQDILGGLIERPLRMNQAEAGILEAVARYAQTHQEVQLRMANAYFTLLEAQESARIIQLAIDVAKEHQRVGQALAHEGLITESLVATYQEELLELSQQWLVLQGKVMVAQATIQGLLDVTNRERFSLQPKQVFFSYEGTVDQAIAMSRQDRPELHVLEAQLQKTESAREANRWMLPKVNLRTTYGETTDEGKGDFLDGFSVGLSGEVPLLLWPLRKAQSDREQAFIDRLELEIARVKAEMMIETVNAYERMRVAQSGLHQRQAKMHMRYAEWQALGRRRQEGPDASQLDVFSAHVEYLKSQQEQVSQRYEQQRAVLALHVVKGALLDTLTFVDSNESALVVPESLVAEQSMKRGLWVWRSENILSGNERTFFLSFLQAREIQSVFLFVSPDLLQTQSSAVREFLRVAHQNGVEVHALNGEPTWIFEDDRSLAQEFLAAVVRYHDNIIPEEQFDAVHLDVEPHALSAWNMGERKALVQHFVRFMDWAAAEVSKTSLPMVFDIPYWYDTISTEEGNLLQSVWNVADQVAIMAYRNSPSKVLESIRQEIELYQSHQKTVWVGLSAEPEFWPKSHTTHSVEVNFESMVQEVEASIITLGENVGVSIQDYAHYREMILATHIHDRPSRLDEMPTSVTQHSLSSAMVHRLVE